MGKSLIDNIPKNVFPILAILAGVGVISGAIFFFTKEQVPIRQKQSRKMARGRTQNIENLSQEEMAELFEKLMQSAMKNTQLQKYDQAISDYEQALAICSHDYSTGPNHVINAKIYDELSALLKTVGRLDEAEAALKESFRILYLHKDEEEYHKKSIDILSQLGDLFMSRNKLGEAKKIFIKCLDFYKKNNMVDFYVAITVDALGQIYLKEENYDEAEKYSRQALKTLIESIENDSEVPASSSEPMVCQYYMRLARIFFMKNDTDKGHKILQELIEREEKIFGSDSVNLSFYMNIVGMVLYERRILDPAIALFLRCLNIYERQNNEQSANFRLSTWNDLSTMYRECNEPERSDQYLKKVEDSLLEQPYPPPTSNSQYIKVSDAKITFDQVGGALGTCYVLNLETKETIETTKAPTSAFVVAKFENPKEPGSPIISEKPMYTEKDLEKKKDKTFKESIKIVLKSNHLTGLTKKLYRIDVEVYSDSTKTEKIGSLVQFVRNDMNLDLSSTLSQLRKQRLSEAKKRQVRPVKIKELDQDEEDEWVDEEIEEVNE